MSQQRDLTPPQPYTKLYHNGMLQHRYWNLKMATPTTVIVFLDSENASLLYRERDASDAHVVAPITARTGLEWLGENILSGLPPLCTRHADIDVQLTLLPNLPAETEYRVNRPNPGVEGLDKKLRLIALERLHGSRTTGPWTKYSDDGICYKELELF